MKSSTANTPEVVTGGCLRPRWRSWLLLRWRSWLLLSAQASDWVHHGVRLPWRCRPHPCKRKQRLLSTQEHAFLAMEVTRMLAMKAIVATKEKDLVVSSIYTVAKKCGKRRPVINLRWVNSFINRQHFKMSTMNDVKAAMSSGCYMATVDLKDCFWALPVCERDQKYLAFEFMGMRYKFLVLPFGLGPSPLFITKLYRTMVEYLQARGHRLIIYIDDILILGQSAIECANTVQALLALLKELGAVVNYVKSNITPMQEVEYISAFVQSVMPHSASKSTM